MSLEVTNDVPAVFVRLDGERPRGLADVVHCPEWFEVRREISLDKLIVTVSVAGELLRGVVGAGVGGILRVILLLTEK